MAKFQTFNNNFIALLPAKGSQTDLDIRLVSKISVFDGKSDLEVFSFYRELRRGELPFLRAWPWKIHSV